MISKRKKRVTVTIDKKVYSMLCLYSEQINLSKSDTVEMCLSRFISRRLSKEEREAIFFDKKDS